MIETPSGKDSGDENFPVGSWLLRADLRPHVAAFYRFARAADDIADNPALNAADKLRRLNTFAIALDTAKPADADPLPTIAAMRHSLAQSGVGANHCHALLSAFRQDAVTRRYATWDHLIDYCDRSANPVGRYLLDLHGINNAAARHAADALSTALQIINHVQDCGKDYRHLDRVYLPLDMMHAVPDGVVALAAPAARAALREVLDCVLNKTTTLLDTAAALPDFVDDRRLAAEAGAMIALARRLIIALHHRDPLAERVVLAKPAFMMTALTGASGTIWRRLFGLRRRTIATAS